MNLYYVQAITEDGANADLMVVAGDAQQAHDIWFRVLGEDMGCRVSTPCLVQLHIAHVLAGYIEWGSFHFVEVEGV